VDAVEVIEEKVLSEEAQVVMKADEWM